MATISSLCSFCSKNDRVQALLYQIQFPEQHRPQFYPVIACPNNYRGNLRNIIRNLPCGFCELIIHLFSHRTVEQSVQWAKDQPSEYIASCTFRVAKSQRPRANVYWHRPGERTARLVGFILEVNYHQSATPQLGSCLIDVAKFSAHINSCDTKHERCQRLKIESTSIASKDHGHKEQAIRLIDVEQSRLIEADLGFQYVALSYVWGNTMTFRTSRSTLASIQESRSLEDKQISVVVRDAIQLVRAFSLRYLWVDALCIVQDDPTEMNRQISIMGEIFKRSYFTIICISARDSNSCLHGVQPCSRSTPSRIATVEGLELLAEPNSSLGDVSDCHDLVYRTRAWTFQEESFSARALYIHERQSYFRCAQASVPEVEPSFDGYFWDTVMDILTPASTYQHAHDLSPSTAIFWGKCYALLIERYSSRNVTYESDFMKACEGVTSALSGKGFGKFYSGLPENMIDLALLFVPCQHEGGNTRRPGFPSWSWAGWTLMVFVHLPNFTKGDSGLETSLEIWIQTRNELISLPIAARVHATMQAESMSMPPTLASLSSHDTMLLHVRTEVEDCVNFEFKQPENEQGLLISRDRNVCGFVYMHEDCVDLAQVNLVLLSQQNTSWYEDHFFDPREELDFDYTERMLNILIVKWVGTIAERVGIGQIRPKAWKSATIRDIVLG